MCWQINLSNSLWWDLREWELKQPGGWTDEVTRVFGPAVLLEEDLTEDEGETPSNRGGSTKQEEIVEERPAKKARKNRK